MTQTTEIPAETMRRAAKQMREHAKAATPGPWERPLDVRQKAIVIAELPENEEPRSWRGGIIPDDAAAWTGPTGRYAGQRERVVVVSAPSNTVTGFERKRSGRDLEHIAGMHPGVALALADWLDAAARDADRDLDWTAVLAEGLEVAEAYLGEGDYRRRQ